MSLSTGLGFSTEEDVVLALKAAATEAREQCPNAVMVLAFVTHSHPGERLGEVAAALQEIFPGVPTAGGEVNGLTYEEERCDAVFANRRAVAVVAFGGEGIEGSIALTTKLDSPREGGSDLAREVLASLEQAPVGGIFLGAGISRLPPVDQQVLDGIRDVTPRLRVTGTGLCGGLQMDGSYEPGRAFLGTEVVPQGIVLAVLGGDVRLGFSAANGMQPAGPGAFVTKIEGPEILELNGRPAKDVVLDLLAGTDNTETREMFARNPQVMSIERGVTLAAPDPEGDFYWCHFAGRFTERGGVFDVFSPKLGMGLAVVRIDPSSCLAAVGAAADMLRQDAGVDEFEITLAFSCSLRGFTLGPEIAREDGEFTQRVKTRRHLGIAANGEVGCYRHGRPMFTGWVYALWGAAMS
jgi:hypothetical protein